MRCDIIMPVWNQLEVTRDCIEHIFRNTSYPYRLIIIDNASDDVVRLYLKSIERPSRVTVIRNEQNRGFVKAVNQGMRLSDAPYLCIMNNDTLPAPGWLEELVLFAETHPDVGMMNPLCAAPAGSVPETYAACIKKNIGKYMEMNQCFLFCALVRRAVVERIGYLDEAFGMGGYDDTDYSRRVQEAGYRCVAVHSSYVKHLEGVSFKALGKRAEINSENAKIYLSKWPRHLRVAVAFSVNAASPDKEIEQMLGKMLELARDWCWVNLLIFGDKDTSRRRIEEATRRIGMPVHQNIKFSYLRGPKYLLTLARVLERSFGTKKRKRYDILLSDDSRLASFLRMFSALHNGKIFSIGNGDGPALKDALKVARRS